MSWQTADAFQPACYGILGEVTRPGVYGATGREVTLQDLVQQAGGLTARSSSTVRILRQGRSVQGGFFLPAGRDVLQPHDVVIVDAAQQGQETFGSSSAPASPGGVWVCFIGVLNRPVIVWFADPQQARLPAIVLALGQSQAFAQRTSHVLPPRSAWSLDAPLPSGTVLVFDRSLLVTQNLPKLPDVVPMADAVPQAADAKVPVAEPSGVATTPVTNEPAWSTSLTAQSRSPVEAIPVPFPAPPSEPTAADPASLPVPGSRIQQQWEATTAPSQERATRRRTVDPQVAADQSVEILPAPADDDAVVTENVPQQSVISLWHMLGIGGTVACLIGIAVATRNYLDRTRTASFQSFERPRAQPSPNPLAQATHIEEIPRRAEAVSNPSAADPDDLDDILRGNLPIVSETVHFPRRFPLQRPHDPHGGAYRIDAVERSPVPMPHTVIREPIGSAPAARADQPTGVVPRPHLLKAPASNRHPKSSETSDVSQAPVLSRGTPLERALAQLQGGRRS
jgi:hypothetical protein